MNLKKGDMVDYRDTAAPDGWQRNAIILSDAPITKRVAVRGVGFMRKKFWRVKVNLSVPMPNGIIANADHVFEIEHSRISKPTKQQ